MIQAVGNQASTVATSTLNSTTTAADFTGTAETNNFMFVAVIGKCSHDCYVYKEFSIDDGVNWDSSISSFHKAGQAIFTEPLWKGQRAYRTRVEVIGTPTYLRLSTQFSNDGKSASPFTTKDGKFGYCEEMDSGDAEFDVWYLSTDTLSGISKDKTFLSAATPCYIASTDNSDNAVIRIPYLDSDGIEQTTNVTLTGNTGALVATMLDCNVMEYVSGTLNGILYLASVDAFTLGVPDDLNDVVAYMPAGLNRTQQTHLTIPANKKAKITNIKGTVSAASGADRSALLQFLVKEPTMSDFSARLPMPCTTGKDFIDSGESVGILPPLTQVKIRCARCSDTADLIYGSYKFEYAEV